MSNTENEIFNDKINPNLNRNLYDPIEAVKAEGEFYGQALSGKYQAKFIIRITFLLGGILLFFSGALSLTHNIKTYIVFDSKWMAQVSINALFTLLGAVTIIQALINWFKEKPNSENSEDIKLWMCSNCQEKIEEQFTSCWKCSKEKE